MSQPLSQPLKPQPEHTWEGGLVVVSVEAAQPRQVFEGGLAVVSAWLAELERMVQERLYTITSLEYSKYGQSKQQPLPESLGTQNAFSQDELLMIMVGEEVAFSATTPEPYLIVSHHTALQRMVMCD
jgi:hypothetical protein